MGRKRPRSKKPEQNLLMPVVNSPTDDGVNYHPKEWWETANDQAEFVAHWGDGITVKIQVGDSDWNDIVSGNQLIIEGSGYSYDGHQYMDVWHFSGGLNGDLEINYIKQEGYDEDDGGVGYLGSPNDVLVKPLPIQALKIKPNTGPAHGNSNKKRNVKIIVTKWPSGTMAMKFGSILRQALHASNEDMKLVQLEPERIFVTLTTVSKREFWEKLNSYPEIAIPKIEFIEIEL